MSFDAVTHVEIRRRYSIPQLQGSVTQPLAVRVPEIKGIKVTVDKGIRPFSLSQRERGERLHVRQAH